MAAIGASRWPITRNFYCAFIQTQSRGKNSPGHNSNISDYCQFVNNGLYNSAEVEPITHVIAICCFRLFFYVLSINLAKTANL